jgi:hypothetical protein
MQFFLTEIVARVVAIYLFVECSRDVWHGLVDRKITYYDSDFISWILGESDWVSDRDATPIRYWIHMGSEMLGAIACLVVAIFGWWLPNT